MDGPLIGASRTKAIAGQISTLADAHASMAKQQKNIPPEIVAATKLLLEELILLGCEWPWQTLRGTRNILATDEASQFHKLFRPSQFVKNDAHGNELVDVGGGRQRGHLRAQARHPAQSVGFTAQLVETIHLRMPGAKICQKISDSSA